MYRDQNNEYPIYIIIHTHIITCVAAIVYIYVFTQFVEICTAILGMPVHSVPSKCLSAYGRLSVTHDFGPHGRLPGIKILYAIVAPWNAVHGRLPRSGHLPGTLRYLCNKFCSMYIGARLI